MGAPEACAPPQGGHTPYSGPHWATQAGQAAEPSGPPGSLPSTAWPLHLGPVPSGEGCQSPLVSQLWWAASDISVCTAGRVLGLGTPRGGAETLPLS